MFDINKLKTINYGSKPLIEGGGSGKPEKPKIYTDENNIQTMDMEDLYFYMDDFVTNQYTNDLVNRSDVPFTSNGNSRLEEMMAVFAMESYSSVDKDGNIIDVLNKPFNVNASLTTPGNDSYSVFQIDAGPNAALPYILMAMDKEYGNKLYQSWKDGTHVQDALDIIQDENVKNKMYEFLKDPNNIDEHLLIAATLWNDKELSSNYKDGAKSWNAYNNYVDGVKDDTWNNDYENFLNQSKNISFNYYKKQMDRATQKNREEYDDLKQFFNMPKLGATIEEAIDNLVSIYEEALYKKEIPEEAAPVDNLKQLRKMFGK